MLKLLLTAGFLAAAAVPAVTMAQPYDSTPRYAGDDQNSYSDNDNDNDTDNDAGDADTVRSNNHYAYSDRYNYDYDRAYNPGRSHYNQSYTGRVGEGWVDPAGRQCRWREVTWTDRDGNQAFKWVPTCRG